MSELCRNKTAVRTRRESHSVYISGIVVLELNTKSFFMQCVDLWQSCVETVMNCSRDVLNSFPKVLLGVKFDRDVLRLFIKNCYCELSSGKDV